MDDGNLFWAVIAKAWPDIEQPNISKKLLCATTGQRAILATTFFIRELDNGGFEQFFRNSSGDIAGDVIAGFLTLGSTENADVVRQATSFFGPASASTSRRVRHRMLQRASKADKDKFFEPLNQKLYGEKRLWPLFRVYLDQHPEDFFL